MEKARAAATRAARSGGTQEDFERRAAKACGLVQKGELSKARQALTSSALAPGNNETLEALTNEERRPPEPNLVLPQEVLHAARATATQEKAFPEDAQRDSERVGAFTNRMPLRTPQGHAR